jgi:hypothetical protein
MSISGVILPGAARLALLLAEPVAMIGGMAGARPPVEGTVGLELPPVLG